MPQLWIVAGPNGAGKTTLVSARIRERLPVVNPDSIAERLPRRDGRLDERRAGELALAERARLLAARESLAVETTLTGASTIRFMARARAAGYRVTLVYVGLRSADLSLGRVADRVALGGHAVPVDAIDRRYPASLANLPLAAELAHRVYLLDNSSTRRRLLFIRDEGRARYVARDLPMWCRDTIDKLSRP